MSPLLPAVATLPRVNRFLVHFADELLSFRWPEIDALTSLYGLSIVWREKTLKPFAVAESASESAIRTLCSRSVLIMSTHELWCDSNATTASSINTNTKQLLFDRMSESSLISDPVYRDSSFRVTVHTFNRKTCLKEKIDRIEALSPYLPFNGPVDLSTPSNEFVYMEYYAREYRAGKSEEEPTELYFGRFLCQSSIRYSVHKFSLKDRKFISNTSMDPKLCFLMCNIGKVDQHHVVLDPFVGSGSILVAAAASGAAAVFGSDIDYKLVHGLSRPTRPFVLKRSPGENLLGNLNQYNLSSAYGDVVLADASRPVFWPSFHFDAILCDPPYGIREASERVGRRRKGSHGDDEEIEEKIPEHLLDKHFPAKTRYNLRDIIQDLLNFASQSLAPGARLVFWMPVLRNNRQPNGSSNGGDGVNLCDNQNFEVPHHPNLEHICTCEQSLTRQVSRVLICLEKKADCDPGVVSPSSVHQPLDSASKFHEMYHRLVRSSSPKSDQLIDNCRNREKPVVKGVEKDE